MTGGNIMQRVFDVIAQHGPIGVHGIIVKTGFPYPSIRKAIARMRDRFVTNRSGRALLYAIKPGAERPVDLRGTHMRAKEPA